MPHQPPSDLKSLNAPYSVWEQTRDPMGARFLEWNSKTPIPVTSKAVAPSPNGTLNMNCTGRFCLFKVPHMGGHKVTLLLGWDLGGRETTADQIIADLKPRVPAVGVTLIEEICPVRVNAVWAPSHAHRSTTICLGKTHIAALAASVGSPQDEGAWAFAPLREGRRAATITIENGLSVLAWIPT